MLKAQKRGYISRIYEIHYIYLLLNSQKQKIMIATTIQSRKKLIDLKESTFKSLSVMAIHEGTNLKRFIENILDKAAADFDDSLLYEHLSKTDPEGKQALGLQEKADFENWLGV